MACAIFLRHMTTSPAAPADLHASRRFLPLLVLLFIGSGCAALIYEIVWLQWLQLLIGSTAVSLGVLLGTFMGGMCLGSLLLPRFISSRRHPLRVYAMLEIGVAVIGLLMLAGMPLVERIYTSFGHGFHGIFLRAMVSAICLLPPTLLMGATLPAIARWVQVTPQGVSWLGFFYGGNIAGAVFGCLLAGFYLLRVHDMAVATYAAAALNVVVAFFAFVLASKTTHEPGGDEPAGKPLERDDHAPCNRPVYLTIALSGLCALGAEVVWTRLVSLMLGGTVYTFSIILAVFLIGLGIGSAVGSVLARGVKSPRVALGICQLLIAAGVAWTVFMLTQSVPYWPIDPGLAQSPWFTLQLDMVRCLWALLPAPLLWGASFPLALAAVAAREQDPGRLVGGVYAANTVGAIVGALSFALLLIPWIGTQNCQRLIITLAVVSGLVTLIPALWSSLRELPSGQKARTFLPRFAALAVTTLIAGWLVATVTPMPWGVVAFGRHFATWVGQLAPGIVDAASVPTDSGSPDRYCLYVGEGMNVSVAVTQTREGWRYFHGAGKVQASSNPEDMRLQRMLGHISALGNSVKEPETVLVVACGAGVTAGSFLTYPSVKHIVICDIEPLVPTTVTPMFTGQNYGIADNVANQNPRIIHTPSGDKTVEVVYDDGRHFIRTTKDKFDIITSDPIDPWVKGCAALNTVEYYEMCKQHLKPGGVMSLWIPLYESNQDSIKSVIATFFHVYPNGIFWSNDINGEGYDAVLFGRVEPTVFNLGGLQERLDRADHKQVKESLAEVNFNSATDLLATYSGRAADMQTWMQGAQLNTDQNLRLQYLAGFWLNSSMSGQILNGIHKDFVFPNDMFLGSKEQLRELKDGLIKGGRAKEL
jgi:spermidine synthase